MRESKRKAVQRRARHRCEYCLMHEDFSTLSFHLEHIIAVQHGGSNALENLAWSCHACNAKKGPNLSGRLSNTEEIVPLFHPRRQKWIRHFKWNGPFVEGKTKSGRATIAVLELNEKNRVQQRTWLIEAGEFPPLNI